MSIDRTTSIDTTMSIDRFDYARNITGAGSYGGHRGPFWPPVERYTLHVLDLAADAPACADGLGRALAGLKAAIEAEWTRSKDLGAPHRTRFTDPPAVAAALRDVGARLPQLADQRAVDLRANMIERGYDHTTLRELAALPDDVAVVAGQISTWYGKEIAGRPTAFACRRDQARQDAVGQALLGVEDARRYLALLHPDLRLGDLPEFAATRLFFMAGEGNLHPKHIAYFLPEDEGVENCVERKTYYFGNTHQALLTCSSAPLAARFLDIGITFDPADSRFAQIPALGVLSHELGHFVHRPSTGFTALHRSDRWVSAVLQEVAADVFGVLILADVWAGRLGLSAADVIAYYLAECLRYTNRGLGFFPDSDGMFLQLSYFTQIGALTLKPGDEPRLCGDPAVVLAGLRSLGRVLADALLAGEADPATALYRAFGPERPDPLAPLVDELRRHPSRSVDYAQEHIHSAAGAAG
jgi:hypothetical protein